MKNMECKNNYRALIEEAKKIKEELKEELEKAGEKSLKPFRNYACNFISLLRTHSSVEVLQQYLECDPAREQMRKYWNPWKKVMTRVIKKYLDFPEKLRRLLGYIKWLTYIEEEGSEDILPPDDKRRSIRPPRGGFYKRR